MAFLRSIKQKCRTAGCDATATQELLSFRNEQHGVYCGRHAPIALRSLQASEKENFARDGQW